MGKSSKAFSSYKSTHAHSSKPRLNSGTYVIESKQTGAKYVGRSSNISERVKQHNSGNGAKWTDKSGSDWKIVKVYPGNNNATENAIAKGVIRNEGFANVRGGAYTKTYYPKEEFRALKNPNGFTNNGR